MRFVIRKNNEYYQPYYFIIQADGNYATLATSEMYAEKQDAINGLNIIYREANSAKYIDDTGE